MNLASQYMSRELRVAGAAMMAFCCAGCFSPGPSAVAPPHMRGATARGPSSPQADRGTLHERASTRPAPLRNVAHRGPFEPPVPSRPWKTIVLHHSATKVGSVATIDAEHRRRKDATGQPWLGIGYHFVIGNGHGMPDGEIEATFRWQQQLPGAHAGSRLHNASGIGICLIGDFNESPPTKKQISSARKLVESLRRRYPIGRRQTIAHRDVKATDCPGRFFPFDQIVFPKTNHP